MKREGSRGFFRSFRLGGRVAGREIPIVSFGRSASRGSVAVLVAVVLTAAHALTAGTSPRPNVVFILADDLGISDLACYGRGDHRTPHLDGLAGEGARFTSAYCAQPICSPSRAAIMTGKHPARLHLTTYLPGRPDCASQRLLHPVIPQQLPVSEKTLAEHLREAGYATACIGKWHLGGKGFLPTDQGFDLYHAGLANTKPSETEGGKGEYDLTSQAIRFIEANREGPFFLYLAHNSPHIAYAARTDLVARNARAFEPVYAAVIETLDDTVGRLLARLEALGLAANTIVVFTSDNGGLHVPEGGHPRITHNTPFRGGKGFLYEGGLRIPLIVRWPGQVSAGRVIEHPVVNTDWLPTLLELTGLPPPTGLDGVSFAGLLTKPGGGQPRRLYWHFPHYTNQGSRPAGAVRDGDWKLIEHDEDGRVEFFNLASDPTETQDLSAREPQRVARLREALAVWRQSVGAQTNAVNPGFEADRYQPLYVDFDVSRFDPLKASALDWERIQAWRKGMNAVLSTAPKAKP
jgi:arylsulfatase A-like enzyme